MHPFGNWNGWSIAWLVWLLIFCVLEFTALGTGHPDNTLSEQVWRLEGNFGWPWDWSFIHVMIAGFCSG